MADFNQTSNLRALQLISFEKSGLSESAENKTCQDGMSKGKRKRDSCLQMAFTRKFSLKIFLGEKRIQVSHNLILEGR
jgi:hypothetical protein